MSILRSKHSGWTWEGRRTPFGGGSGGGGGAPTQTTTYSTNIPEYARPYVENMLQATQSQIFNPDMTTFRPYQPYSTNVSDYVAGFSPLQQQAQRSTAGLQAPQQFGAATGLAGTAGLGGLGLTRQMAGAGGRYAQMATSPEAQQAYMSPYMQNVVDYQKSQALRDYQIGAPLRARAAVGAGAFGGSRQAIESAEAQRSLMSQLQGIEATGRQQAFQQAQQAQQFGANLGLQGQQAALGGLGAATQAAGTLGQLGGAQLGAQRDIIGLQSQMGAQQQALEQQKINQAIQDYAIAQQYPFMQLGLMNAMLRGLPLQTQTTQLYQAQPTALQQGIGLAGAGMSLFGRKEGGVIKMAKGGIADAIPGYKYGKLISEPKLESMADDLTIPQLQQRLRDPALTPGERQVFAEALQEKMQQEKARMSGIAMAGGPAFESQGLAGGGIVAFDNGGTAMLNPEFGGGEQSFDVRKPMTVEELFREYPGLEGKVGIAQIQDYTSGRSAPPESARVKPAAPVPAAAAPKPEVKPPVAKEEGADTGTRSDRSVVTTGPKTLADFFKQQKELGPKGQLGEEFEKFLGDYVGDTGRLSRKERMAAAKGFLKFASTPAPGGIGQAAAAGLTEYATGVEAARDAEDKIKSETAKAQMELNKARRAEERGDVAAAQEAYGKYEDRMSRIQAAQISAGAAGQAGRFEREAVERVMAENPGMKFADALQIVKGAGRFESTEVQRMKAAQDALNKSIPYLKASASKKPEDQARALQIRNEIYANFGLMAPGGGIGGGQGGGGQGPGILRFDAQGNLIKG